MVACMAALCCQSTSSMETLHPQRRCSRCLKHSIAWQPTHEQRLAAKSLITMPGVYSVQKLICLLVPVLTPVCQCQRMSFMDAHCMLW